VLGQVLAAAAGEAASSCQVLQQQQQSVRPAQHHVQTSCEMQQSKHLVLLLVPLHHDGWRLQQC
jgi:hypothetical protein